MERSTLAFISLKAGARFLFAGLLLVCQLTQPAYGQVASTGAIYGTVADTSGGGVPAVEVKLTNQATGVIRSATTSAVGFFSFESVLAGTYNLVASKLAFQQTTVRNIVVYSGQRIQNNITLQLGTVETQVMVEAVPVKVETESGESAGVITGTHVQNLLLNGRNFLGLGLLVPGVNSASSSGRVVGGGSLNSGGLTGDTPLSINGLGREFSLYTIDGAYNMNTGNNININITPAIDSIAEFRILKDNYSAKYGVAGSAQVMTETKSGGTQFHGGLYEFLRNDKLDANNFFSGGDKTPLKQNNFGFAIGGPLIIPKVYNTTRDRGTFFFVNEEWRVVHSGLTLRGAMPTEAMRNGDFSQSATLGTRTGANELNFDDVAQKFLAGRPNCLQGPTKLNPACFDPNAVALMNRYWPLPNNPSGGFLNYINPGVDVVNQRSDMYRVDQYFGSRLVLMGRWMYEEVNDSPPAAVFGPNPAPTTGQTAYTTGMNALLRLTANIKPTIVNTTSLVYTHDKPRLLGFNAERPLDLTIQNPFGIVAVPYSKVPSIFVGGGWAGIGVFPIPVYASDGEGTISDDISIVKGSHVLQVGGLFIWGIKRQNLFTNTQGAFSFSGIHANDPMADFLLGLPTWYGQSNTERRGYFHYRQFEPYFQDDWKVTPRLTVNLGVRYVYISPDTMDGDGINSFDPAKYDPSKAPAVTQDGVYIMDTSGQVVTTAGTPADLLNGVIFAGKNGVPRGFFTARRNLFVPRVGFAWDPTGSGRTSVRGGYGIGYSRTPFDIYGSLNNPPYVDSITLLNGTLTNPAAGVVGAKSPVDIQRINPDFQPTRIQTWSLTVEREIIPRMVVAVAYVGSGSRHVKGGYDLNFPLAVKAPSTDGCLHPGQAIPSRGFDFDPCLNTGSVSSQITRPYQGWGAVNDQYLGGTSNYHSLQSGFRYQKGPLTLNAAYTFGKTLSDVADRSIYAFNTGAGAQNPRNFKAEYGPPGWDRTHIFTSGYVYELPLLRNRKGVLDIALSHWTFSGITVIESGFALAPGVSGATGLSWRPDVVAGQQVAGPKTLDQWFNTSAFALPAYGFFGNAGTGLIRGPGEVTCNWALFKSFPIKERAKLQFRAEAFNIFNHPSFSGVETTVGSGDYGHVNMAMEPRILEFALRFDF